MERIREVEVAAARLDESTRWRKAIESEWGVRALYTVRSIVTVQRPGSESAYMQMTCCLQEYNEAWRACR